MTKPAQDNPVDSVRPSSAKSGSITKFSDVLSLRSDLKPRQKSKPATKAAVKTEPKTTSTIKQPLNNNRTPGSTRPQSLWRVMVVHSLSAPIGGKSLLASILKNVFSWRFVLLISLPIIVANLYWMVNVNLASVESTVRNWLNPSRYGLYALVSLGLVVVIMLSAGFQALLFPYGASSALQQGRPSWRQANAKFFRQLIIVIAKWIIVGAVFVLSLYVAVVKIESVAQFLLPATLAKTGLLFIAATLLAIIVQVNSQMSQLICLQSNTGVFRAVLRSLRLQLSRISWFCAEVIAQAVSLIVQIGLFLVTAACVYWGLMVLSNNLALQAAVFLGLFLTGLLILVWLDLINWQQWAGGYKWIESQLKPTQLGLIKTHQSLPERSWPAFAYLILVVAIVAAIAATLNSARPSIQASMAQLQSKLPSSNQRIIPSSRHIRYNIP